MAVQAFRKVANGPLWFGLPITSISNSQVVLNVNAASLQLVVNASPGKIMFGQVCTHAWTDSLLSIDCLGNIVFSQVVLNVMQPSRSCWSMPAPAKSCLARYAHAPGQTACCLLVVLAALSLVRLC